MPASLFFLIHPMNTIQTILIAIIEGITEFLPISSTAHMKFANPFLGIEDSPFVDLYEIVIQLAAILSVVVVYYKTFFNFKDYKFYLKLMVAVFPALVFGALLKKYIDAVLDNLWVIAVVMVIGGIALIFIDRYFKKHTESNDHAPIQFKQAFWVGCFQVLAILFPGLSRSAATIIGGLSQKLSRKAAAEFSFFLAVPTMLAASAKSTLDVYQEHPSVFQSDNLLNLCMGGLVAFLVALVSVKYFIQFVQKRGFALFGWYRIVLGLSMLLWLFLQKA
ncbi:MAG: Undecaprenyl-diphosphatase [Bacteroidota bacterium]|jgi:undecaprenyl-diphosphatase